MNRYSVGMATLKPRGQIASTLIEAESFEAAARATLRNYADYHIIGLMIMEVETGVTLHYVHSDCRKLAPNPILRG